MRTRALSIAVVLFAGCTTTPHTVTQTQPAGQSFTGEVWVWDEQRSTVTLRQVTNIVRVKVTPDQLRGLRIHEIATVRGEPEAEAPIQHDVVAVAMATPRGAADDLEVTGAVAAVEPAGTMRVEASDGPVTVWTAAGGTIFQVGERVRVHFRVQPLALVALKPGETPPPSPAPVPPAFTVPGDYAAVRGRVLGTQPRRLTVESPRGPVTVAVPSTDRYIIGGAVEVQTSVLPADPTRR
jgi:hypothetical protein